MPEMRRTRTSSTPKRVRSDLTPPSLKVSLIIPVFNARDTLRDCVLSLLQQEGDPTSETTQEIIIVDDGSTDGSTQTVEDLPVLIVRQENKGAAAARNRGALMARGDLLIFVDADVRFFPGTLRRMCDALLRDDVDYVTVLYDRRPWGGGWLQRYKALIDFCYGYDFIYRGAARKSEVTDGFISGGTEGFVAGVFQDLTGYDESIAGADVEREDLLSRLIREGYRPSGLADVHTSHRYPPFSTMLRNTFVRSLHTTERFWGSCEKPAFLRRNSWRVALSGLVIPLTGILLAMAIADIASPLATTMLAALLLLAWAYTHAPLLAHARREYGHLFVAYAFLANIFFSLIITVGGALGALKGLFHRTRVHRMGESHE